MKSNTDLESGEWQLSENVVGRRFYERDSDEEEGEVRHEMIFELSRLLMLFCQEDILAANLPDVFQTRTRSCTDRETLLKLGLWDVVFDEGTSYQLPVTN